MDDSAARTGPSFVRLLDVFVDFRLTERSLKLGPLWAPQFQPAKYMYEKRVLLIY